MPVRHKLPAFLLSLAVATPAVALDLPAPLTDEDFLNFDQAQVQLGQLLFYDKVLSGNQNISCATCHHPNLGSADGVSLGVGEGGVGIGPDRTAGDGPDRILQRVPRNAPGLWNLGHRDVAFMFHDGRVEVSDSYSGGFKTPALTNLPEGLNSVLAAQALFPMTSDTEMAGQPGENEMASAANEAGHSVWPMVADRVRGVEGYVPMFVTAFDSVSSAEDISIVEIANAIAAFEATEFKNFDSPFDNYLAGDKTAMSDPQKRGMELFFGVVGCSDCHAGSMLSNQSFQALGLPLFGPGRDLPNDPILRDVGRLGQTDEMDDAYRFRVPFLRNVALTGPYGHNGAMPTLADMVRHHLNPAESNANWRTDMANLPPAPWLASGDFALRGNEAENKQILSRIDIDLPPVTDAQVNDIVAFLNALTGETAMQRPLGRPDVVPSGLPVD